MLKSALEASRTKRQTRLDWIRSERERLAHGQRVAEERADLTRGSLPRVHRAALENLETVLQAKEQFEQKIALESLQVLKDESDEDLDELCRTASDVPKLWNHPEVTHQERKEILRCIIEHILIQTSGERIDAVIVWKTGARTPLFVWRPVAHHHLIRELHAKHLTNREIKEHLAAGKTSTGQVVMLGLGRISLTLKKMGLKKHKYTAVYIPLGQEAAELQREGRSYEWIARYFNEQAFPSPSGKPWTRVMVKWLRHKVERQSESLEELHRRAISDALARGLDYKEIAIEFNEKKLGRGTNYRQPWTAKYLILRWGTLRRRQQKREEEQSANAVLPQLPILKKSA